MAQEASLSGADATYDAANTLSRLSTFFLNRLLVPRSYVLSRRVHYRTRGSYKNVKLIICNHHED